MLKTALLTLASTGILTSAVLAPPQSADAAASKLHAAQSFTATLSIQLVGGATTEATLVYSKPNHAKIDTPDRLKITDGQTMTELDKKANSYSTSDFSDPALLTWLTQPEPFGWNPFFIQDTKKLYVAARSTGTRKLRGVEVATVPVTLANRDTADLYIETATNLVRGFTYNKEGKTWIVWATKLEASDKPLDPKSFTFVAPEGAKDAKSMPAVSWETVAPIFAESCMPCHGQNPKAGLDLRSYETASKHRSITPGDSASSRLVRSIKGQGKAMPPGGPALKADEVAKIEAWINAGAKN